MDHAPMSTTADAPDVLRQLMQGEWIDPDGGSPVVVPVRAVAIERSLRGLEAELVASLGLGRRLAVVSDATTRAVLGERVERALDALATVLPVVLAGQPHADADTSAHVRRACASADALIAVGSGTINDLCKHAAAADGKPYAVFATAPSMNGYTSTNAAITVDGHKQSLAAAAPAGVFMDLEVLAHAPARMIRAGLGDSLCRSTAQADWLLSHHLLGTPYRRAPFALLAQDESMLLDEPEALLTGDPEAMRALARTPRAFRPRDDDLRRQPSRQPGRASDQSLHRHVRASWPRLLFPWRAGRGRDADDGAPPGGCPRRGAATTAGLRRHARHAAAAVRYGNGRLMLARVRAEAPVRGRRQEAFAAHCGSLGRNGARHTRRDVTGIAACHGAGACRWSFHAGRYRAFRRWFYSAAVRHARFLRNRYTFLDLADDSGHFARMGPGV